MQDRIHGYRIDGNTALQMECRPSTARIIDFPAQAHVGIAETPYRSLPYRDEERVDGGCSRIPLTGFSDELARKNRATSAFTRKQSAFLVGLFGLLCILIAMV